jgi:hypothetical protein
VKINVLPSIGQGKLLVGNVVNYSASKPVSFEFTPMKKLETPMLQGHLLKGAF